jgi:hypothetical protein
MSNRRKPAGEHKMRARLNSYLAYSARCAAAGASSSSSSRSAGRISARSADVRAAQQIGVLASLPQVALSR